MAVKTIARPAGQSTAYKFLLNEETGRQFKATNERAENILKQPTLSVSIAVTDAAGKALVNADGEVELFTHTHVFTQAELTGPAFNAKAVLDKILSDAILNKERDLAARNQLDTMLKAW